MNFFERIPDNIEVVLTMNHDQMIEPVLTLQGFSLDSSYQHRIYENFNAKLWRRAQA